ncbi:radical SAM protein [Adlercreutzia sp. ZJ304]|uniref:radical SAM/SPASM domain-containing protein n=1 Tax=Adlercreutzia sp. ZJ304 TaxID=2709791 RepID=UPI0013EA6DEB|nr:radical SAM protein [Adlercreutzia sp. ZJ304]
MELKPSRYNIVALQESRDGSIVYNTRTGALALVDESIAAVLGMSALLEESDFARIDARAVAQLARSGLLVAAACDELAEAVAEHRALQQDSSVLSLCIVPTYTCNLACPYCYEEGRSSSGKRMDRSMQKKIVDFARLAFEAEPYESIEVQWYGGEPMLMPDAIDAISAGLMRFCEERGLGFSANMVSNATRIGAEEAAMLGRSRVTEALVTVDGPEAVHNGRRPMRNGGNSYEAVLDGIGNLLGEGIGVTVLMNTDKVNDSCLSELNSQLQERFGMSAIRAKLNDYYGTFGRGRFCEPRFSLMDHREFSRLQCERFCEEGHAFAEFAALLQPIPLFCRGQKERYYAIDAMGDVYKCDGRMGRTDHLAFNLDSIGDATDIPTGLAPAYPFDDPACPECSLLPLCKGNCEWERKQCADHPCHPLKYTANEYLYGWVASIEPIEIDETGVVLLAEGRSL